MFLFLQAMALDLAAIEIPRSKLVDADHAHDWIVIEHEMKRNEELTLLDRTPTPAYVDSTGEYPTALIRGAERSRKGEVYQLDILLALDCGKSAVAVAGIWESHLDGMAEKERFPNPNEFKPVGDEERDRETRDAVFKHVCGPEWSYTPSQ